ncbi:MAG: two-component regulator propeller domain-containing protein [Opitutus sp.]
MAWTRRAQGNIWVMENGQAAQLNDGRLRCAIFPSAATNHVIGLAATPDGGVWILSDNRIRKWQDDQWTEDRGTYPWAELPPTSVACCLELRDGTLAIGTINYGLHLVFRDGRPAVHFDVSTGLPQNWVRFLHEDREGNLWAGAGSAGLVSIHATAFSVFNLPAETRGCSVLSVAAAPDASLWIGTDGSGLYRYRGGRWDHFGPEDGLANWYAPAVAVDSGGEEWVQLLDLLSTFSGQAQSDLRSH